MDIFRKYPDDPVDFHVIRLHKGATNEWDQFITPGIQINCMESDRHMTVLKDAYHDVKDLEPIIIDHAVWQGFSAVSADVPPIVCG